MMMTMKKKEEEEEEGVGEREKKMTAFSEYHNLCSGAFKPQA